MLHAKETEQVVIGCLLANRPAVMAAGLSAESFWFPQHREVFRAIQQVRETNNGNCDIALVCSTLDIVDLDKIGGAEYLRKCRTSGMYEIANAEAHSTALVELAAKRDLIARTEAIQRRARLGNASAAELAGELAEAADGVLTATSAGTAIDSRESMQELLSRLSTAEKPETIATGFTQLDDTMLGGIRPGQLVTIGARPSDGKSALAMAMAGNMADAGTRCGIISTEMQSWEITQRMIAAQARVPLEAIVKNRLSPTQQHALEDTAATTQPDRLFIVDDCYSEATVLAAIHQLAIKHHCKVVILDYLQEVDLGPAKGEPRTYQLGRFVRKLKLAAQRLGIVVVTMAQLNRNVESKNGAATKRKPAASDLRESGAIEQASDTVLLLWQDIQFDSDGRIMRDAASNPKTRAWLSVGKCRSGWRGREMELNWEPEFTRFSDHRGGF